MMHDSFKEERKIDPFIVPGRMHPSEHDWRGQIRQLCIDECCNPKGFVLMDICKIAGLAHYILQLQEEARCAKEK